MKILAGRPLGGRPTFSSHWGVFVAFVRVAWAISRAIRWFTRKERKHQNLARALDRLASGVTVIVGLLVAAVIAFEKFTPARLIEMLGLSSVAIGFAFRDVLHNYLAGILLLITEPFRIGDPIIFGSYEGTVEDI